MKTHVFASFESRQSIRDLLSELGRLGTTILSFHPGRQCPQVLDRASNAPPGPVRALRIALPIHPESRIVLTLDEEVSPLLAVGAPGLHGSGLVHVVFVSTLLVGLVDDGLDAVRRGQGPEDQGPEEGELPVRLAEASLRPIELVRVYPLSRVHAIERGAVRQWALAVPGGRPLRLVRVDRVIQGSVVVSRPVQRQIVSMCAASKPTKQSNRPYLISCFLFSRSPSTAQRNSSARSPGIDWTTSRSRS